MIGPDRTREIERDLYAFFRIRGGRLSTARESLEYFKYKYKTNEEFFYFSMLLHIGFSQDSQLFFDIEKERKEEEKNGLW